MVLWGRKNRVKVPYGGVIRTCCLEGKGGSFKGRAGLTMPTLKRGGGAH